LFHRADTKISSHCRLIVTPGGSRTDFHQTDTKDFIKQTQKILWIVAASSHGYLPADAILLGRAERTGTLARKTLIPLAPD
jgi:hypothetical protein